MNTEKLLNLEISLKENFSIFGFAQHVNVEESIIWVCIHTKNWIVFKDN